MSCIVLTGHVCGLNATLNLTHVAQDGSNFLFMNKKENIQEYYKISVVSQAANHAIGLTRNCWAIF